MSSTTRTPIAGSPVDVGAGSVGAGAVVAGEVDELAGADEAGTVDGTAGVVDGTAGVVEGTASVDVGAEDAEVVEVDVGPDTGHVAVGVTLKVWSTTSKACWSCATGELALRRLP